MIAFLLAGVVLAGALLVLLNWWAHADVKSAKKGIFWLIILVCLLFAGLLMVSGRGLLAIVPAGFAIFRMFGPGLITSYVGRRFGGGNKSSSAAQSPTGPMSEAEALEVLGLRPGAGSDEINEAYRKLMAQVHPDKGGSDWMAAKLNEARKTLLNE